MNKEKGFWKRAKSGDLTEDEKEQLKKKMQIVRDAFKHTGKLSEKLSESFKQYGNLAEKIAEAIAELDRKTEADFERVIERNLGGFRSEGFYLPDNWQELVFDWYLKKYDDNIQKENELDEKGITRELIIEWAEDYKNRSDIPEFSFVNNFSTMPENEVYEYFYENLFEQKYLSIEILNQWILQAFEKQVDLDEDKKFIIEGESKKIQNVFSLFYIRSGKPYKKAKDYAKLLGGYFKGYKTESVRTNWTKS